MHIEMRCLRKVVSLFSPETALTFRPKSAMNLEVEGHSTPKVSKDTGWKVYLLARSRYLITFLAAAAVEADPTWEEEASI